MGGLVSAVETIREAASTRGRIGEVSALFKKGPVEVIKNLIGIPRCCPLNVFDVLSAAGKTQGRQRICLRDVISLLALVDRGMSLAGECYWEES